MLKGGWRRGDMAKRHRPNRTGLGRTLGARIEPLAVTTQHPAELISCPVCGNHGYYWNEDEQGWDAKCLACGNTLAHRSKQHVKVR